MLDILVKPSALFPYACQAAKYAQLKPCDTIKTSAQVIEQTLKRHQDSTVTVSV